MRSLSVRERLLAIVAVLVLAVALMDAVRSLEAKHRELEDLRRQIEIWRASSATMSGLPTSRGVVSARPTKDTLLEMAARAGRRLDSIQISQTEHGISAVFVGEPAAIWAFYAVLSDAGDAMVQELSLKNSGGRRRGTLELAVVP